VSTHTHAHIHTRAYVHALLTTITKVGCGSPPDILLQIEHVSARARVVKRSLIFERILSKFAENILYYESPQVAHGLYTFHVQAQGVRVRACVCESARVVKRTLIFERIFSQFAENILRIATNCMGYVLFMFKHRDSMCVSTRVAKRSLIFGRILSKSADNII
jgi:hypothetical protein